jgi:hypothetical protein
MTEPSDEQIIADAMLLGVEFVRLAEYWYCTLPKGKNTVTWTSQTEAAKSAINVMGYTYRNRQLTKRR